MKKSRDRLKSFVLPSPAGVEIISGQHIINDFRRHVHKTYIIGMVTQGGRVIDHPHGTAHISQNEIFIINPGLVHSCRSECREHSYHILSITPQTMLSMASHISEKHEKTPYFKNLRYNDDKLRNEMTQLFNVISDPESDIQVEDGLHSFLSDLILRFSESPPAIYAIGEQKESINRACEYIRHHFSENLSLKTLADTACLSPFHFQREFKKTVGITPHEYLNDFRISVSKTMLLKSDNIADIAVQSGFFDQGHFSRIFKKAVGISPGKYLKINKTP